MANENLAKAETDSTATAGGDEAKETEVKAETPVTETEATAPEKESTTPTEKPTPAKAEESGKAAVGVEGYEKMLADAKAQAKAKAAAPKAEETPAEPAEEETPQEESAADTEEVTAGGAEISPTEEADTEKEPPNRIRIGRLSERDRAMMASATELAAAEGIDFEKAWARITGKPATQAPATETTDEAAKLRTRAEIQAEIVARKAEKKQAATDLDTGKMYEADEAIEALRTELGDVDFAEYQAEENRKASEQAKFTGTVSDSKTKAVANWPEAGDEKSAFSKRMVELADDLEKDPDPGLSALVYDADAPFVIARMVAKELGILPKHLRKEAAPASPNGATKPSTSTAATKPAPVNQRAVGRPAQPAAAPASGAARTTQEGSKADPLGLDNIHNPYQYEEALKRAKKLAAA